MIYGVCNSQGYLKVDVMWSNVDVLWSNVDFHISNVNKCRYIEGQHNGDLR